MTDRPVSPHTPSDGTGSEPPTTAVIVGGRTRADRRPGTGDA
ncbi:MULTISPECIES: hypothetical protein [unclassified Streptomyces]|nr:MULTISPECIES: hypothetical protein [unclassified Streptomyces]